MGNDRYTVRMLEESYPDFDIEGVCRQVRYSLEQGIIPVIEIEDQKAETSLGLEATGDWPDGCLAPTAE